MDEIIKGIVAQLDEQATRLGFNRRRGGAHNGMSWSEISGRHIHGTHWGELRLYHRPDGDVGLLTVAFIQYPSLAFGGGSRIIGEQSETYDINPASAVEAIVSLASKWLEEGV